MNPKIIHDRLILLTWVFIPIIMVWFSTGYLLSANNKPDWVNNSEELVTQNTTTNAVMARPSANPEKLKWNGQGLVTLWFDDAWESQFSLAYPLLSELSLVGALAVPSKMINFPNYMSWYQVKSLQYHGWEITSHTRSHSCNPDDYSESFVKDELEGSLRDLTSQGLFVDNYVTPCGLNSALEIEYAKKNYLSLRTTIDGHNPLPIQDHYNLKVQAIERTTTIADVQKWLDEARQNGSWLILMFHQIDDIPENKFGSTYQTFSDIIKQVKQSGLSVVTPSQVLHLVVDDTIPIPQVSVTPAPISQTISTVVGFTGSIKARSLPEIRNDNVITQIRAGTYPLLAEIPDWYQIQIPDPNDPATTLSAWVSSIYLVKNND
jgi:peptidoglycan/xylan/chitin deacetylase (PgdA/CDA1 family)